MPFQLSAQFRETSKTGFPLLVWGYAVALAVFLTQGAYWLMLRDTPPSEAFFLHNANRLQVLKEKTSAAALGMVILGDSRARYSIHVFLH